MPLILIVPSGINKSALLVQSPNTGSSIEYPPGFGSVNNTLNCIVRGPKFSAYNS